jgi:pimeloyl-ACP methyl ester carboxylesterase
VPSVMRDGVQLYFEQQGKGPPMMFVHGWCCDHGFFGPLLDHFATGWTVTLPDLRGCGRSDHPESGYDVATFADDLAHLCEELDLDRPVLVGHSFGGVVAIEFAARYPSLPAAIVALDPGPVHATPTARAVLEGFATQMEGPDGEAVRRAWIDPPGLERLGPEQARFVLETMTSVPLSSAAEVIRQTGRWNGLAALVLCGAPLLVVLSRTGGSNDPARLLEVKPDVQIGVTVGAGHFHQLEVPEQIIPMIERFLADTVAGRPA